MPCHLSLEIELPLYKYPPTTYTFLTMTLFISSLAGFISFMVLDYLWLAVIAKKFYLTSLTSHITIKDGSLIPYLPAVPFVYAVAVLGIFVFVTTTSKNTLEAFLYGSLLGFILYAFYDFTNLATLKDYSWQLTLVDILWGTLLVGTVSVIMFIVKNIFA